MKTTGRDIQLARQIGEHLVAAELGRKSVIATPFAGNVPMFDLLAVELQGRAIPVQAKAIRGASWQFNAKSYLEIRFEGEVQFVDRYARGTTPELLCIFVVLKGAGQDEFYIFQLRDLQEIMTQKYSRPGGRIRPINPQSTHCAIWPKDLEKFRNNWPLVEKLLAREGVFGARQSPKKGKPNKMDSVEVDGVEYRSVKAAWQSLQLGKGDWDHKPFRLKLKRSESGTLSYTEPSTGKTYEFRLTPFNRSL
jgi:hypothetical protein